MKNPWIQTRSGTQVDLLDPQPDMIKAQDFCYALSNICRFTGHCSRFYSVAEHTLHGHRLIDDEHKLEFLLHDAHEAYTSDVSRPLKYAIGMEGFIEIEKRFAKLIRSMYGLPEEESEAVRLMDGRLLATETRDLMPPLPDNCPYTVFEPLDIELSRPLILGQPLSTLLMHRFSIYESALDPP